MRSFFLVLAACGGGSDPQSIDAARVIDVSLATIDGNAVDAAPGSPDAITPDGSQAIDAGMPVDAAGNAPGCTIPASLGTATPVSQSASRDAGPPAELKYAAPLNTDAKPDIFKLVLIDGRGAMAGGIAAKTVQLGGVESKYATCGACVEIFSDVDSSNNFAAFFIASSGTLTITSVSPRITGTLTDATLVHLDDNDAVVDSCTTHVDSLAFDVPVQ